MEKLTYPYNFVSLGNEEEIEEFFDLDKKNSIKIGENYFSKVMHLKEEYREVDIKNPNNFIKKLFNEVERWKN